MAVCTSSPYNRTIVELKRELTVCLFVFGYPYNRTIVELKPKKNSNSYNRKQTYNRTIVELKLRSFNSAILQP